MKLPEGPLSFQIIEILEDHGIDTIEKLLELWAAPEGKLKIQFMQGIGTMRFNQIKRFVKNINGPIFDTRKKK